MAKGQDVTHTHEAPRSHNVLQHRLPQLPELQGRKGMAFTPTAHDELRKPSSQRPWDALPSFFCIQTKGAPQGDLEGWNMPDPRSPETPSSMWSPIVVVFHGQCIPQYRFRG